MSLQLSPNFILTQKGTSVCLLDIVNDDDVFLMVDGELAGIFREVVEKKVDLSVVLARFVDEDRQQIREFFTDLLNQGVLTGKI